MPGPSGVRARGPRSRTRPRRPSPRVGSATAGCDVSACRSPRGCPVCAVTCQACTLSHRVRAGRPPWRPSPRGVRA
ncbi:MAG: hypothetical protein ACK56I_04520, partial [bacterium]